MKNVELIISAIKFYFWNNVFSFCPIFFIRLFYLKKVLKIKIGKNSYLGMGVYIVGNKIEIGDNSVVNRFTYLDGRVPLKIGNNVNISNYTYIQTLTHNPYDPQFSCLLEPVIIKDNVWIGARSIILTGVTINEGAVIGAGAVVTKNIPAYTIAVGVPAKVIKKRNKKIKYKTIFFPIFDTDIQLV